MTNKKKATKLRKRFTWLSNSNEIVAFRERKNALLA